MMNEKKGDNVLNKFLCDYCHDPTIVTKEGDHDKNLEILVITYSCVKGRKKVKKTLMVDFFTLKRKKIHKIGKVVWMYVDRKNKNANEHKKEKTKVYF